MRARTGGFSLGGRAVGLSWLAAATLSAATYDARADTLLPGFFETSVASGLSAPTRMEFAPDGRIFVCQQGGVVRVIKNGSLLPTSFVSLSVSAAGERGVLGIAFDPNFNTNGFVYVYHTVPGVNGTPAHNRVSRFTANGDVAVPGSEQVIVDLDPLSTATNHNGGDIHFGPDGKLYVAVGENANPSNSQSLTTQLGKILRLNPDGTIPSDNPFLDLTTGGNQAIWAMGLRNPFSFAFQPGTGTMFINDVGQNLWEEIDRGIAGANYGWPFREGPAAFTGTPPPGVVLTDPIFWYHHGSGTANGNTIAGGGFYNPTQRTFSSSFVGDYFYGDFINGWIRSLDTGTGTSTLFASGLSNPVDLKIGADGGLYFLSYSRGSITRIQALQTSAPEPASLALLGVGLPFGVASRRRRH